MSEPISWPDYNDFQFNSRWAFVYRIQLESNGIENSLYVSNSTLSSYCSTCLGGCKSNYLITQITFEHIVSGIEWIELCVSVMPNIKE